MRDPGNPPSTKWAKRPLLVGVSGKKRHGKGAIAEHLVEKYDFVKIGFKDALIDACVALNPIVGWRRGLPTRFAEHLEQNGYEGAKDHPIFGDEFVRVLQDFGIGIREIDPDFWVKAAGTRIIEALGRGQSVVVDDMRFPNEAGLVRSYGGSLWRVTRHPAPKMDLMLARHVSETALDNWANWNVQLRNDGTLGALHGKVDAIVRMLP